LKRGRALAVAFNILVGGASLTLLAGMGLLSRQDRTLDTLAREGFATQTRTLEVELATLDRSLGGLFDQLLETGSLAGETRERLGLGLPRIASNRLRPGSDQGPETRSDFQVAESLRQARALHESFQEIVNAMEANAAAWAGIPSKQPLHDAQLTSGFGMRRDPFNGAWAWHQGLDLCADTGTPIQAAGAGRVVRAGYHGDFGQVVELDHGNGLLTLYAHTSRTVVEVGDWVDRGDTVAFVGMTGRASAPHLHYEVHVNGAPVDPEPYILPAPWVAD
jgi:murein DD-endopeptidase MepM/ murein hydrolase activator NlpD